MTGPLVRIFVNERPVEVEPGITLRDLLAREDPALADALDRGTAYVTDGVGRRIEPTIRPGPGAIFRVIRSARRPPDALRDDS